MTWLHLALLDSLIFVRCALFRWKALDDMGWLLVRWLFQSTHRLRLLQALQRLRCKRCLRHLPVEMGRVWFNVIEVIFAARLVVLAVVTFAPQIYGSFGWNLHRTLDLRRQLVRVNRAFCILTWPSSTRTMQVTLGLGSESINIIFCVINTLYPIYWCLSALKVLLVHLLLSNWFFVIDYGGGSAYAATSYWLLSVVPWLRSCTTPVLKVVRVQYLCIDAVLLIARQRLQFLLGIIILNLTLEELVLCQRLVLRRYCQQILTAAFIVSVH